MSKTSRLKKTSGLGYLIIVENHYLMRGIGKLELVTRQTTIDCTCIVDEEERKFHSNTNTYTYFWVLVATGQYTGELTDELMPIRVGPVFSLKESKRYGHSPSL